VAVGRCAALRRWYCGVREHLIVTPGGGIAFIEQLAGNRHDVQGLYALLKTSVCGLLVGDTAYWPRPSERAKLAQKGIEVLAATDRRWGFQNPPEVAVWIDRHRHHLDRWISLFDQQFHADRTLCRNPRHYEARRWTKVLAFNAARYINRTHGWPKESVQHFHLAA